MAGWLFPPSSRKLSNLELKPQTTDRASWGSIFPLLYGLQFRVRESGQTSRVMLGGPGGGSGKMDLLGIGMSTCLSGSFVPVGSVP